MEGLPSEVRETLAHMNWEERLADARARRAEVLRKKGMAGVANTNAPSDDATASSDVSRTITPQSSKAPETERRNLPAIVVDAPREEEKSSRFRVVGAAFGAGLLIGIVFMLFQGRLFESAPVVADQISPEGAAIAPKDSAVRNDPVLPTSPQQASGIQAVDPSSSLSSVVPEIATSIAQPDLGKIATGPGTGALTARPITRPRLPSIPIGAVLPRADTQPQFGTVPVLVSLPMLSPRLLDLRVEAEPLSLEKPSVSDAAPSQPIIVALTDGLLEQQERDFQVAEPVARPVAPSEDVRSVQVGADTKVWIFASSAVQDAAITVAEDIAQGLDIPVQGVNRVGYRISRNQVRFYDTGSAQAARLLADQIGAEARDFTNGNFEPPEGTLEVYLGGSKTIAQPTGVSRPARQQRSADELDALRESLLAKIRAGLSE